VTNGSIVKMSQAGIKAQRSAYDGSFPALIRSRRHARFLSEDAGEVVGVGEADSEGDLSDVNLTSL
jgi:hypothetical protein